jgi:NADP-dependent 3-hydroxy acid dehydrogenase YdfG
VNFDAFIGMTGQNAQRFSEQVGRWVEGTLPADAQDANNVAYWTLSPEDLAAQIVAVINTPWGLNISDITVRATGEDYVL